MALFNRASPFLVMLIVAFFVAPVLSWRKYYQVYLRHVEEYGNKCGDGAGYEEMIWEFSAPGLYKKIGKAGDIPFQAKVDALGSWQSTTSSLMSISLKGWETDTCATTMDCSYNKDSDDCYAETLSQSVSIARGQFKIEAGNTHRATFDLIVEPGRCEADSRRCGQGLCIEDPSSKDRYSCSCYSGYYQSYGTCVARPTGRPTNRPTKYPTTRPTTKRPTVKPTPLGKVCTLKRVKAKDQVPVPPSTLKILAKSVSTNCGAGETDMSFEASQDVQVSQSLSFGLEKTTGWDASTAIGTSKEVGVEVSTSSSTTQEKNWEVSAGFSAFGFQASASVGGGSSSTTESSNSQSSTWTSTKQVTTSKSGGEAINSDKSSSLSKTMGSTFSSVKTVPAHSVGAMMIQAKEYKFASQEVVATYFYECTDGSEVQKPGKIKVDYQDYSNYDVANYDVPLPKDVLMCDNASQCIKDLVAQDSTSWLMGAKACIAEYSPPTAGPPAAVPSAKAPGAQPTAAQGPTAAAPSPTGSNGPEVTSSAQPSCRFDISPVALLLGGWWFGFNTL